MLFKLLFKLLQLYLEIENHLC